ncbi:MAG TPA: hypothetical protein DCO79_14180 [Spirochaeta sp.]|nr:hypothetical protein [Spirochaeta sp.]
MADKKIKAPGIFKRPVKKEKWQKKFIKKLYLPEDRKFLKSLAVEEDGYIRVNVDGLSRKDKKRLKALGKVIKKNRKAFNFILIFILILLVGGAVFFHFYLKNKLVQRLVETQLEKVFLAEVDTKGVNLSVIDGRFSLSYLAIADSEAPMKNLIEFSSVEADLKTAELLQGRVFIEELGFSGMKRGTARETSGLLNTGVDGDDAGNSTETGGQTPAADGKDAIGDVINQLSALAGNIDLEELLEQQKANLASFSVIEESKKNVDNYSEHWKGRVEQWDGKIDNWETSVSYISKVNADSFATLDSARTTITRLRTLYDDAEEDFNEVRNDYNAAEKQYNETSVLMDQIKAAVKADYDYVESLVSLPAGDKVDWAASILEEQLSMPLTKYLSYLERGLSWYNRFKRFKDSKEAKKPEDRRISRSLPPPVDAPPTFTLVHAFASGEEPDLKYRFDLHNLVSEPEKWDGATSLDIGLDMPQTGAASAVITEDSLSLDVPAAPFDLGNSLSALDIAAFSGSLALDSSVGWDDDRFSGNVNLSTADLVLKAAAPDSILYRLISTSLESVKPVTAFGEFKWSEADGLGLKLDTELDESLGDAAKVLITEGAEEGIEMLRSYLGEQLEGPLADFDLSKGDFEGYVDQIKNYETELDSYRQMADDKIAEIEKSIEDKLKKQAEDALKDGAADVLKDLGSKLKF